MNIVEFALKFKDLASGGLGKFANSARSTFNNAGKYADDLNNKNKHLGKSYDELSGKIKGAKDELSNFNKQSSGGGMLSSIVKGNLISQGLMKAGSMAAGFFGDAMSKSLERQQILTSFSVLAGSKGAGDSLAQDLIKYQEETILGPEVFKNAQTMMSSGFKSSEVMDNLKMLGDVSMGDADKLGSLTLAFSQIRQAGKLQGQELLQLINAGFSPLEEISKRTGKSIGELKDEMASGNISFEQVQQAFRDATSEGGKFNNMLSTIAQTPAGKMQALSGAWNEFKINAGAAFMPLISKLLGFAAKMLPKMEELIKPLSEGIEYAISLFDKYKPQIIAFFAPVVDFFNQITTGTSNWMQYIDIVKTLFVEHIWPVIKKVWNAVWDIASKLIEWVKKSELIKDIFKLVSGFVGMIWDVLGWIIDQLKWIFDNIVMPILNAIEKVYRWIKGGNSNVKVTGALELPKMPKKNKDEKTNTGLLTDTAAAVATNNTSASNAEKSLSSGGPKVVNITIGKFLEDININTNNLTEGVSDIEGKILEMFARVVSQGAVAI